MEYMGNPLPVSIDHEIAQILLNYDVNYADITNDGPLQPLEVRITFTNNIDTYFEDLFSANFNYVRRLIDLAVKVGSKERFDQSFSGTAMHNIWEAQKEKLLGHAYFYTNLEKIYRDCGSDEIALNDAILFHICGLKPRDVQGKPFNQSLLPPKAIHPTLIGRNNRTTETIYHAVLDMKSVTNSVLNNPLTWEVCFRCFLNFSGFKSNIYLRRLPSLCTTVLEMARNSTETQFLHQSWPILVERLGKKKQGREQLITIRVINAVIYLHHRQSSYHPVALIMMTSAICNLRQILTSWKKKYL